MTDVLFGLRLLTQQNRQSSQGARQSVAVPVVRTMELVAHKNYIVVLVEDATSVRVLNAIRSRQKWPPGT